MLQVTNLVGAAGGVGSLNDFPAGAVALRNQTYLQLGEPTGNTNTKVGTLSFWMKRGYWGNEEWLCNWGGNWSPVWIGTDEKIYFATNDTSGSLNPCYFGSTIAIPRDFMWHHYAFAFSLGTTSVTMLYIDGVSRGVNVSAPSNTVVGWAGRGSFLIGRRYNTNEGYLYASLAEFYFNTKEFVDFRIADNLAKFRNPSNNKPVNLGPDGSWVTGSKPLIYLRHDPATDPAVADFRTNLGSGLGTFTLGGDNPNIYREPCIPSGPWTNVYGTVTYWGTSGFAGYTIRMVINPAGLFNVPKGQTQVRVTVASDATSNSAATWDKMYIGHQTGSECAAADLTQLFFLGGAPGATVSNRGMLTSDAANWVYNGTSKIVVTVHFSSAGALSYAYNTNVQTYWASGDFAALLATSGYTAASLYWSMFFASIEMV